MISLVAEGAARSVGLLQSVLRTSQYDAIVKNFVAIKVFMEALMSARTFLA